MPSKVRIKIWKGLRLRLGFGGDGSGADSKRLGSVDMKHSDCSTGVGAHSSYMNRNTETKKMSHKAGSSCDVPCASMQPSTL
jgi:hypothetical protein